MGCCVSTDHALSAPKKRHVSNKPKCTIKHCSSKSPPPTLPLSDEETVKEVLSETPTVPKQPPSLFPENETDPFLKAAPLLSNFSKSPDEKKQNSVVVKKPLMECGNDELSGEVPEICSTLTGGDSVSPKIREKRENVNVDGNDDVQEARQRSPARFNNRSSSAEVKREKPVGKSPGRTSEPLMDRSRPGSVSSSRYGRKKDTGEISGRRSRSPVGRTDGGSSKTDLGRTQSGRRIGKSPSRVGSGLGDRIRKGDEGKESGKYKWQPTGNESFENPVVSLECFIFL